MELLSISKAHTMEQAVCGQLVVAFSPTTAAYSTLVPAAIQASGFNMLLLLCDTGMLEVRVMGARETANDAVHASARYRPCKILTKIRPPFLVEN